MVFSHQRFTLSPDHEGIVKNSAHVDSAHIAAAPATEKANARYH